MDVRAVLAALALAAPARAQNKAVVEVPMMGAMGVKGAAALPTSLPVSLGLLLPASLLDLPGGALPGAQPPGEARQPRLPTREEFQQTLSAFTAYPHGSPLADQRQDLAVLAAAAGREKDVRFLARLAVLSAHDPATQHLMVAELDSIRGVSLLERAAEDARDALRSIERYRLEALPARRRAVLARRLRSDARRYLP